MKRGCTTENEHWSIDGTIFLIMLFVTLHTHWSRIVIESEDGRDMYWLRTTTRGRQYQGYIWICSTLLSPRSFYNKKDQFKLLFHAGIKQRIKSDSKEVLTLLGHANIEAFLQSTGLAPVPRHLVNDTDFVSVTRVHHVLLDAPPKETLTQWTQRKRLRERNKVRQNNIV